MRIGHLNTQNNIYSDHLTVEKPSLFQLRIIKNAAKRKVSISEILQTNYSIVLNNFYAFILLHLKRTSQTTNILNINIPEVCIFHAKTPFQIVYSKGGQVKAYQNKDKLRLKEVYNFFYQRSIQRGTNRKQQSYACFQNQQFLLLSDSDLFINCHKFKNDSFFTKLHYLRNKINVVGNQIAIQFQPLLNSKYTGLATESLIGFKDQSKILLQLGQVQYLHFLNEKISLFLNFEHNIRVNKAIFFYSKTDQNQYFLVNVKNLEYNNFTDAIKDHQRRLKLIETQRNKILIMSPEKYTKHKNLQKGQQVKQMEKQMNSKVHRLAESLNIITENQRKREDEKNGQAFQKLYPFLRMNIEDTLNRYTFSTVKKNIAKMEESKLNTKRNKNKFLTCQTEKKEQQYSQRKRKPRYLSLRANFIQKSI